MIDFANEVFGAVAGDLRFLYPTIHVVGEYVDVPARFPAVTVDEVSNVPTHLDSADVNKYARVTYRVQVFSNLEAGKRGQAREIYSVVDNTMMRLGLYAATYTTTPAIYNSEIYCITATYEGVIGDNGVIYRA